jgi:hypothetical protein
MKPRLQQGYSLTLGLVLAAAFAAPSPSTQAEPSRAAPDAAKFQCFYARNITNFTTAGTSIGSI